MASFYCSSYGMVQEPAGDGYICRGPGRQLQVSSGPANQLYYAQFEFANASAWQAFSAKVRALKLQALPDGFDGDASALALKDPDGNLLVFSPPSGSATHQPILLPAESTKLNYEGEIAVVISKAGRRIKAADAWDYVAGYSAYNDGFIRDWQKHII